MKESASDADENLYEKYYSTHDHAIREKIILNNLHLVQKIIRKFLGKGLSKETLFSTGCIALIHAVDRYDPHQGVLFSTYAYSVISGEIKHHFRDQAWDVSVPRSLKEDYIKINREIDKLTQKRGRYPTISEVSSKLELSEERVIEALEVGKDYHSLSLDSPTSQNDENQSSSIMAQLAGNDLSKEEFLESIDLKEAVNQLPQREQLIVKMIFFQEMNQQDIAKRLNISQIHVSRLLRKAVALLKEILK